MSLELIKRNIKSSVLLIAIVLLCDFAAADITLGVTIEQRIENFATSLQTTLNQIREENERTRREIELLGQELQLEREARFTQAIGIQAMNRQHLADAMEKIAEITEILLAPINRRKKVVTEVLQKAKSTDSWEDKKLLQSYLKDWDAIAVPTYLPMLTFKNLPQPRQSPSIFHEYHIDYITGKETFVKQLDFYFDTDKEVYINQLNKANLEAAAKNKELENIYHKKLEAVPFPVAALVRMNFRLFGQD